jgi:hypothetical protein
MSQAKVVRVGFRVYQNLAIAVTDAQPAADAPVLFTNMPEGHAEYVELRNIGTKDCYVRFNRYTNDVFLIKAGTTKELPLKVNKIYAYCGTATDTTTLEITGYAE